MKVLSEKARISIRTDAKLKEDATRVLAGMHLDLSTAFNLFLDQVVKQNKLPFEITNETAAEKEQRALHLAIQTGLAEAKAGKGIPAKDYLASLEAEINQLEHESL
ncbi:type II toxin-antitoxin system RelB/DinJ family antitoxin [Loigolactobacillus bifermentans]|uniref:DNA-damage-inducible protein J n=1 Tax=Loigolactobacillus bifermentans DSM 20003 TaxID=1423726 RepID=A0A0R1H8J6_9LACO|nr:type II toxin-antitoxin system RelB/DinJ family antitoxin [Loigolactobacillus bifermentans]KRK39882.1 hypothetical protein FC07_GL002197 [Loigolactobacillus bifermentans DSM 20003]QGG60453.1 type II toxin-antitoxin system RelB/DinJ family antitoxin [Loigolactobacillus bifermentans]